MKNRNGFTLVELLAVIVVLALIMIIAIPTTLDSISIAKKKSFIEYIDKIYQQTRSIIADAELEDEYISGCKIYYIKTDLNLSNTGNYVGYVIVKEVGDDYEYYITMHDDTYLIPVYKYDGTLKVDDLQIYDADNEITADQLCAQVGCTSCYGENATPCQLLPKTSDSTPGTFKGRGTSSDPYRIESVEDLVALSLGTNNGTLENNKYYMLTTDLYIDCDKSYVDANKNDFSKDFNGDGRVTGLLEELTTGKGFTPIGNASRPFNSHLNGNNKTITSLLIDSSSGYAGLIGNASSDDYIVENLTILDANIKSSGQFTGMFVGNAYKGNIMNVHGYGNITCVTDCGGIVGSYTGSGGYKTIENVSNHANIIANGENVAGVAGSLTNASIKNVYNYGELEFYPSATLASFLDTWVGGVGTLYNDFLDKYGSGGIVGTSNNSSINNAGNEGKIKSNAKACNLGGIVGFMIAGSSNMLSNSYNKGEIESSSNSTGGIVGRSIYGTVYNVVNYADVSYFNYGSPLIDLADIPFVSSIFSSLENSIGGVVGNSSANSYIVNAGNQGNVSTDGKDYVGGVVGHSYGVVFNVYNYGDVISNQATSGNLSIGGIAGLGSAIDAYTIGDVVINNYYTSKSLLGGIFGGNSDTYTVGLAIGTALSSDYNENIYAVGTIRNNYTGSISYGTNYGGLFGKVTGSTTAANTNFYSHVSTVGLPKIALFAGNSTKVNVSNVYVDMYTTASDIKEARASSSKYLPSFSNFKSNINDSPYGSRFSYSSSSKYTFDVNTEWFRDTLQLGSSWKYESGSYPVLFKLNLDGTISNEIVQGQKKIDISTTTFERP